MSVNYEGEDSAVSFNPRFLLDPLKSIPQDKITLDFRDDMSPGVFKVTTEKDEVIFLCVVMPIRTD
jgi:DNA polymerase-3 subunit beta